MLRSRLLAWGLFLGLVGCVNLNVYVYFDQKKLDDAADKFVLQVRKDVLTGDAAKDPATETPVAPKQGSWLRTIDAERAFCALFDVLTPSAHAAEDDRYINTDTPAIRKIQERMTERARKLVPFFNAGNIGESNRATLDLRNQDGLSAKDKGQLRTLVKEENGDREELFREVAAANRAAESEIEKIRKAWAKAFRERTNDGWWIQTDEGDWVRKGEEK